MEDRRPVRQYKEIWEIDLYRWVFIIPARVSSPFYLKYLNVTDDGYSLVE
ncbi:hypothetical protein [Thermococcus sp.]